MVDRDRSRGGPGCARAPDVGLRSVAATRGASRAVRAGVDRTVSSVGSRSKAESELAERERRHDELDIVPLSEAARTRYTDDWQRAEQRFVDDPELAAREADSIVRSVLDEKGYPDDDFDARSAAVSVDHPNVVAQYRHGHEMVHGDGADGCRADRDLRKAMVDFRSVFEQLVETAPEPELSARA